MRNPLLPFIIAFLVLIKSANAATVTVQDAQGVAVNFFKLNAPSSPTASATLQYTATEPNGAVDFYVFSVAPLTGFVIVAADDAIEPVIGFSSESDFDIAAAAKTGIKDWMNTASAKISGAVQHHVRASATIASQWTSYRQGFSPNSRRTIAVAPLLTTSWNQEPYYNQLCPFNTTDNQRSVTGCVATAMAQIMKYWNYPATGNGSYTYNDATSSGFSSNYGTQSANFGTTTYAWSSMPASLTANNTSVATLMYHCGVAVAMDYGDDNQGGSGAYVLQSEAGPGNPCAQYAYANFFRYNANTLHSVYYANYTSADWITLMEGELNAGRPVQYEGADPSAGGHTWVCDGYNTSNQLHMNWGWGGTNNGYFSVTNLSVGGYTFSAGDAALIGIQPLTITCSLPTGLTSSAISGTAATLSWAAVAGATSYNLQYKTSNATAWTTLSVSTQSKTLTGLTSGTVYDYQVQTVCSSGSSAYSAVSTFTTLTTASCAVPSGLSSSALTTTGATLNWTAVNGASTYNLQYKASTANTWNTISVAASSKVLTGLTAGTLYDYQVQTICSGGSSAYSVAATFTTSANTCGVSIGLNSSSITATDATLAWAAVSGASSYNLQYKISSAANWTTVSVTGTAKTLTGLTAATLYDYQVQAVCPSGSSAYSTVATFTSVNNLNYCTAEGSMQTYEWISHVEMGSINRSSAAEPGGYVNTGLSTNLHIGSTADTIFFSPGFSGSAYTENWSVFVDFNKNGVFTDAGEEVVTGTTSGAGNYFGIFNVPAGLVSGPTRMRVMMGYSAKPASCGTIGYGEVEDYIVNLSVNALASESGSTSARENMTSISEGSAEGQPERDIMSLYPNPAHTSINIQVLSFSNNTATVNIFNVTGQKIFSEEHQNSIGENVHRVNISALPVGIYVMEMINNGNVIRQKFSVTK